MRILIAAVGKLKDDEERSIVVRYAKRFDLSGKPLGLGPLSISEFPESRAYADIVSGIKTGRSLIEAAIGRPINGYVPPWNTASPSVLKALTTLGFTHISASRSAVIHADLVNRSATIDTLESYAPVRVQAADTTIALIQAAGRRADGKREHAVGVMHHIKDLGDAGLQTIEQVVAWSVDHRIADSAWRDFVGQGPTSAA